MKINMKWADGVKDGISQGAVELKQACLAGKIHKELNEKSMEQVLAGHLPNIGEEQRKAAAQGMELGVKNMYCGLDDQVSPENVKAFLDKQLAAGDCTQQGRFLVGTLKYVAEVNPESFEASPRWEVLKAQDSFQEENVAELQAMFMGAVGDHAGFMARQEFQVMERSMGKLSDTLVDEQVDSGKEYARAYAAAMYITSQQSSERTGEQAMAPEQIGLLAAQSVESSRLLAQCHYGKLRMEEALPKLARVAEKFLLEMAGFAFRVYMMGTIAQVAFSVLAALAVAEPLALLAIPIGLGAAAFMGYKQEDAVSLISDIWQDVKDLIGKIFHIGKPAESIQAAPCNEETVSFEEMIAQDRTSAAPNQVTV